MGPQKRRAGAASLLALLLAASLPASPGLAFNLDTRAPLVHAGPPNSYFGYSVAQHFDRRQAWLLVGAPKGSTSQPGLQEAGAVFKCSVSAERACQPINFDINGSATFALDSQLVQADDRSHQRFGSSLHSANGSIVACAPNYVYLSTDLKRRDPVGSCYISRGSFTGFMEYSPCRQNKSWGHHALGSCQAGFSSAVSKDGSGLYMGAPGAHVWQGQVFLHNMSSHLMAETSAKNPHSEDDSYLGYSLALGRFSGQSWRASANQEDVVIGIPRSNMLAGSVMLADRELRTLRNISGQQMGSYFGYSLAVLDLNGDGQDDLAVGAPLYFSLHEPSGQIDRGRVYLYLQARSGRELGPALHLDGLRDGGRFGTALASCGDLNRDGIHDLAVGAPHDGLEGRGAVHIFMGRSQWAQPGPNSEPIQADQVIYAEMLGAVTGLRSFGFSLSGGLDMDENSYPDLLVGDYLSDRAILLKARPVVNVRSSFVFQPDHLNLEQKNCPLPSNRSIRVTCVTLRYCLTYTGQDVDQNLKMQLNAKLDANYKGTPRLYFHDLESKSENNFSLDMQKDRQECGEKKLYVLPQIRDKLNPMQVELEYNLAPTGDIRDSRVQPILNKLNNANKKVANLSGTQESCGPDKVCHPNLRLSMTSNLDSYHVGSGERIRLDIMVQNLGENAYESVFYLTMPHSINFENVSPKDFPQCSRTKPDQTGLNMLICDLGNPQTRNDTVKFSVQLEPGRGPYSDFTFRGLVNSSNLELEQDREDNQVAIGIPIKVKVDLVLSGSSQPAILSGNTTRRSTSLYQPFEDDNERASEMEIGPEIHHNYLLQNRGPSPISELEVRILWPLKTSSGYDLLYLMQEPIVSKKVNCNPVPAGVVNPRNLTRFPRNELTYTSYQKQIRQPRMERQTSETSSMSGPSSIDERVILHRCDQSMCYQFECLVSDLGQNETVTITIRSRLAEKTLSTDDDILRKDHDISSLLVAQIKSLPYNDSSQSLSPYKYKVETQIHMSGQFIVQDLPPWIILLAILLGLLLLILLVWLLKYLGFFARRRPPKGAEREPLTPTIWNDYQYTPGDTAL